MFASYLEVEKTCYYLFLAKKTIVAAIWREKIGFLLFGDQKMEFTSFRSKEKDYNIYLKSEKLVHSNYEYEKNVSQLFGS